MKRYWGAVIIGVFVLVVSLGFVAPSLKHLWEESTEPTKNEGEVVSTMREGVTFQTDDGVTIVGDWYAVVKNDAPAVLLLHMMPATKESWRDFAAKLAEAGFSALAIDLRGHGESTKQGPKTLDYRRFADAEHQASRQDVKAALEFLRTEKGVPVSRIGLAGASIGANLALQALTDYPELKGAILLSPGLNYRGIETEPLIGRVGLEQAVFFVASRDDVESVDATQQLYDLAQTKKDILLYDAAGHGTTMLVKEPALEDRFITWLKEVLTP